MNFLYNFGISCSNDPYSSSLYVQCVVMCFKVHSVEKIYLDLQLYYDSREELGEFVIVKLATTVAYFLMVEQLSNYFGYIGNAWLYYLNPAPRSELPTALVKTDGQEDVNQLVHVHAYERTRIYAPAYLLCS